LSIFWVELIALIILLFLSAFFSSTETALTAIGKARVRRLVEEKKKGAVRLERLLSEPQRFLATILLGNNLVNVLATALATDLSIKAFDSAGIGIATGLMTFFILVFGEITPKTLAIRHTEKVALLGAKPIYFLGVILYPLARLFIGISQIFMRILGESAIHGEPFLTQEEIKAMIKLGEEEGVIEEGERELIHSVFEFGETIVREIMVPRTDMVCLSSEVSVEEAIKVALDKGFSRIPVYEGNIDNIVGIFYLKDAIAELRKGRGNKKVSEVARSAYFVPEAKKIDELLKELQKYKVHMAIVLDEYGGTSGLVTIEDILEEIVGEIFDEYDVAKPLVQHLKEGKLRIDARLDLGRAEKLLNINFPEDADYDTIGGFVYDFFGRIPVQGEKLDYNDWEFVVEKVEGKRISKILAVRKEPQHERAD
jgi:CBS domain containing-hemolysin-like protein